METLVTELSSQSTKLENFNLKKELKPTPIIELKQVKIEKPIKEKVIIKEVEEVVIDEEAINREKRRRWLLGYGHN